MRHLPALTALAVAFPAAAAGTDPAYLWIEAATRDYYNAPLRLAWERPLGDWIDAAGARHAPPADIPAEVVATTELDTGGRVE